MADAAVESLLAADVTYDNAVSGLAAGELQAAVDELAGRMAEADSGRSTLSGAVEAWDTRIQALEEAVPPRHPTHTASDIAYDGVGAESTATTVREAVNAGGIPVLAIDGVEGDDVQSVLAALAARIAAQEAALTAQAASQEAALAAQSEAQTAALAELQGQVEAPPECPDGMTNLGGSCIQDDPHQGNKWHYAGAVCASKGLRLCRYEELRVACLAFVVQAEPEWTADWVDPDLVLTANFAINDCTLQLGQGTAPVTPVNALKPYRCCKTL